MKKFFPERHTGFLSGCVMFFLCHAMALRAQTPEELASWLPPAEGWKIAPAVEVFNPDNLFDRINGAAPLYLEYNFREMTALEYAKSDNYITIQAYRHAGSADAFGIYATERSPRARFFPVGGEAHGNETSMCFFAGNMYVKMWGSSTDNILDVLLVISKSLADRIDSHAALPPVFGVFPPKDRVAHSEAYIASSYIGHEFLNRVATVQYVKDSVTYQAFVVERDRTEEAKKVLNDYFSFTRQPSGYGEGHLTIKDRYNGDIPILWKGRYIAGVFSESGDAMPDVRGFLETIAASFE